MADSSDIQLNLHNDQAGQVVQQNVPAGTQTTLAFKVEQWKVPDYWGAENEGHRFCYHLHQEDR